MRPGTASLPGPGFTSANSRLFAFAPPGSFTCALAAVEAGPVEHPYAGACSWLMGVRDSPNCCRKPMRCVSFSPGRCCPCSETGSVGADISTAQKFWRRAGVFLVRREGTEPPLGLFGIRDYVRSAQAPSSHSPVVLVKDALVEFSPRF